MGKFLSTILGLIIVAIVFGFLWFIIPLGSSVLNASPLYLSFFVCGIIFLASFFSLKIFKSRYMKIMPVALTIVLGGATIGLNHDKYSSYSYKYGVLIRSGNAYNKFGQKIIDAHGFLMFRYMPDGTPVILELDSNSYAGDYCHRVYTLDGVCIANDLKTTDGLM